MSDNNWRDLYNWTVEGERKAMIEAAMPEWAKPSLEAWCNDLSTYLYGNEELVAAVMDYQLRASYFMAVVNLAKTGLPVGGKFAHLEVRNAKRDGKYVPGGIAHSITYHGMIELAYRSGNITAMMSDCAYDADTFRVISGTSQRIIHEQKGGQRNLQTFVAAYAIATLKNGSHVQRVCWPDEISAAKEASRGSDKAYSPWNKHPDAMARKTAVRRLYDYLPRSAEMEAAITHQPMPEMEHVDDVTTDAAPSGPEAGAIDYSQDK